MRLFATSDLHLDFGENWRFVEGMSDADFTGDALIVAGDVAHRLELVERGLNLLRRKFAELFYVPGNHELWVRGEEGDSPGKFRRVMQACQRSGVRCAPGRAGDWWVVPLFSWYEADFDGRVEEADLAGWGDFRHCRWPEGRESPAAFFAGLNETHLVQREERIVSFSHFLPRAELLPERHFLRFKGLPGVAGSRRIEAQVRRLGAQMHFCGHTHIRRDLHLEGVRYVQDHLGYPRERRGRNYALKLIE